MSGRPSREQWEIEFRVGPGETDGRRGMRVHRLNVDPAVCPWFDKNVTDPSFPIDPRVGAFHVYVNGELKTSIVTADMPPVSIPPGDLARAEQLRGEAVKIEARVSQLSAQAGVDEHRLRSLQAEIVACEARVVTERERVAAVTRSCDEEVERARKASAEARDQITKDLVAYREAMLSARTDMAQMFEHMRTAEVEEARHISKRRQRAMDNLTQVADECADLESAAIRTAASSNARPSIVEQVKTINPDSALKVLVGVIDAVRRPAGGEAGKS